MLKTRLRVNKETDTYEHVFYNGRRRATPDEIKAEIRSNFSNVKTNLLPNEYRSYYNKVKGGKARAAKAVRIEGKYINDDVVRKSGFEDIAKLRGFKNAKELLEKDSAMYEAAKELYYSNDGLKYKYYSENVISAIDDYSGRIFINGKELTKLQAIERVDRFDKLLKRTYGNFLTEYWTHYKAGGSELHLNLPSETTVRNKSIEEMLDFLESSDMESIEILESERNEEVKKKDKNGKDKKEYKYKIKIIHRKKRKTIDVSAVNLTDARQTAENLYNGSTILQIDRQTAPKPKKNKK